MKITGQLVFQVFAIAVYLIGVAVGWWVRGNDVRRKSRRGEATDGK